MPISTNSPIREILWNKLYAPQYQTVDQNNIAVGNERYRKTATGDAMMQEQRLALMEQLKANPTDPALLAQMQKIDGNMALPYEDKMKQGLVQDATYQGNLGASDAMLNQKNLTKEQDFKVTTNRVGGSTLDKLFKDAESKPAPDASNLNAAGSTANPKDKLSKYNDYKNFIGAKK
jgi:hypothetical protein